MSRVATLAFRPFKLSIVQAAIAALLVIAAAILLAPTVRDPAMPSEWMRATLQASTLAIATLGSEDLTCITAAQLVRSGQLSWTVAIVGCTVGIYFGDLGLWLVGRLLLGGARRTPWVSSQLPMAALGKCETWFDRRGGAAIFAARFLPGFRLPMYLAAGAIGRRPWQFAGWSLLAAVIWTPALIMATAIFGDALVEVFGRTWLTAIAAIIVMYALLRVIALLVTERGRLRLAATIARIWRWEFWPAWLFYIPTAIYIAYLSIRHGGFNVITAANPAIPLGGFVGESKCEILRQLDATFVVPFARVTSAGELYPLMNDRGWRFPIILKPDVGERGASVRRISNLAQAEQYLAGHPGPTLVQPFHPGPHEAGIFYYRLPGAARGEIFSITDKILSELIGDGTSTFEELIWRHSRYRMQATVFLKRHAEHKDRILQNGERFLLAMAGNHCQGTMFRDGIHLVTPKLAARIDQIARSFEGFFIGRFDVRYSDVAQFMAGKDLAIVELNGVTAESSNIYDPRASLLAAYRTMFRQWRILFAIAKTNIARGHCPAGHCEMLRALFRHYINRRPDPLAD